MGARHPQVRQSSQQEKGITRDKYQMTVTMTVAVTSDGRVFEIANGRNRPVSEAVRENVLERLKAQKENEEKQQVESRRIAAEAKLREMERIKHEEEVRCAETRPPSAYETKLYFQNKDTALDVYRRRIDVSADVADAALRTAAQDAETERLHHKINRFRTWLSKKIQPSNRFIVKV